MANSARGVMKIPTEGIKSAVAISEPVAAGRKAGIGYTTIAELKGVLQLDKLDDDHAVVLIAGADKSLSLKTIHMP